MDAGRTPFSTNQPAGEGSALRPVDSSRLSPEDRILQLEDQLRLRQDALAHLGHDLRTPLNSIIGFSELMQTGIGGVLNPKHKEFVDAVHRNGHLMLGLINDLLDWSTIDGGKTNLRLEDVDLARLVEDVRACTEPVVQTAGLFAEWPEAATLKGLVVRLDPKRVLQILLNLIDNASKFTPRGGRMAFSIVLEPANVVFTVQDSGPGIPRDEADRIFRPYWSRTPLPAKGAGDRIAGASGTGLGLSIVQAIVRLHNGQIVVDRGILGGARFQVTIPRG